MWVDGYIGGQMGTQVGGWVHRWVDGYIGGWMGT